MNPFRNRSARRPRPSDLGAPSPHRRPHAAACLAALVCAPCLSAQAEAATLDLTALWRDPVFQRQFVGAYGIDAEVEPRVTPEEVKVLEKVRPLLAADDLAGAEAVLRRYLKRESSAMLDVTLGGILFQQDRLPDALEAYQGAVAKFPSFRRAYRNLGLIHARNGSHPQAIAAFTRMIELGGGDAYAYGLLGYCHAASHDYQAAETAYRNALLLQPDNAEWRLGLTRCVFKQRKYEDAAALLDTLIVQYPDKTDFWLLQAHTYLGMKQPLAAAGILEALALLGKASADSLHTLGDIYVDQKLLGLATRAYQRALDADPAQAPARPLRAVAVLTARGALDQARHVAQHLRRLAEERLGDAERRQLHKLEVRISMGGGEITPESARVLEELLQNDPLDGEALLLLGQHHARQNEPERAMLCYERAAGIAGFEVQARVRHAQVLVGMARYADAGQLLRRAQEIAPRDDVARYLEQVDRLAKARR
jgi:tetratricopeptide (TPR) repeat protein